MNKLAAILLIAGFLTGCARPNDKFYGTAYDPDSTGHSNDKGTPYTNGGDARVPDALAKQDEEDAQKAQDGTPAVVGKSLRERMIAFSLIRKDKDSKAAKRFGKDHLSISVFLRKDDGGFTELKFEGEFTGNASELIVGPISSANGGEYSLSGNLKDLKDKVKGAFTLTNSKTSETGKVLYRAYKAKINVRTDESPEAKEANKKFASSILQLKTDTFAWVNNWIVVKGPSFYSADIVRIVYNDKVTNMPVLSFNGAALKTGEENEPDHISQVVKNNSNIAGVKLVGDAGDEGNRLFEVTLKDQESKDQTRVMVEMEEENPEPKPIEKMPEYTGDDDVEEAGGADNEPAPAPAPVTPQVPNGLRGANANSFLAFDLSDPVAEKMVRDYESNWDFSQVQSWIKTYHNGGKKSGWRTQMANFFYYAKPFKPMIEAIASIYGSPASFSYLTLMESNYFKGKSKKHSEYVAGEVSSADAVGIFQILVGTARGLGMKIDAKVDERTFFAPAGCGASAYLRELAVGLKGKDSTLAILAYKRGPHNVNKDMQKALRFANSYNYTFQEMAKFKAIITDQSRNYVLQFLATYFIAGNPAEYGFSTQGRSELPGNRSVFPPGGIHSPRCQQAMVTLNIP